MMSVIGLGGLSLSSMNNSKQPLFLRETLVDLIIDSTHSARTFSANLFAFQVSQLKSIENFIHFCFSLIKAACSLKSNSKKIGLFRDELNKVQEERLYINTIFANQ